MSIKEILPTNCEDKGIPHRWAKVDVHGCGAGSGDHAVDEALVLPVFVFEPSPGSVCNNCFQKFGEPKGTRDKTLVAVFKAISAW